MKKKHIKYIVIPLVILVIGLFSVLIYINLFAESNDSRLEDLDNYKLTKDEINAVKDKVNELDEVDEVLVYADFKIIKIVVKLESDIDFDKVKAKANETIECISEENLSYFDVEFFVDSKDEDSEVYPKIGYKHKSRSEYTW